MRADLFFGIFGFFLMMMTGCHHYNTQQPEQKQSDANQKEMLVRINQHLVDKDTETIRLFADKMGWQMKTTESGLWYMVYHHGNGEKVITGKTAKLAYTLSLPDSIPCYSSDQLGPKIFRVGQGGVETGLEEGVLLLHVGDKARFIMPPHLAHGLTGDGICIPRRSIILYDVELLDLE